MGIFTKYDSAKHHRRSIRLRGFDYSEPGTYFVTLCTYHRECLFGDVMDGTVHLNEIGNVVVEEWTRSSKIRLEIELDEWVVMPNHLHGIVVVTRDDGSVEAYSHVGAHGRAPLQRAPQSLGSFIAGFKSSVTTRINQMRDTRGAPIWQRNYYEHIIRNERDLNAIRAYIINNPVNWLFDLDNPMNASGQTSPQTVEHYLHDAGL